MTQCADVINNMVKAVDNANTQILENMIDKDVEYMDVCLRPNVSFDHYYETLKTSWENIVNNFINRPDKCPRNVENLLFMYEVISDLNKDNVKLNQLKDMSNQQLEQFLFDKILGRAIDMITDQSSSVFAMDKNMIKCMKNLGKIMVINCQCQMIDIFSHIVKGYKATYAKKLQGLGKEQILQTIRNDYEYVKNFVVEFTKSHANANTNANTNTQTGGFSVENELNNLIPDELGKMKKFFIKVLSTYFNNLHPIIWAQIFRGMVLNIFKDCPLTAEQWYSFGSKYLLLNSGPFILKILQMIRPVLTAEQAKKYNLTKLTYPLLERNQVDKILDVIMIRKEDENGKDIRKMSKIITNRSASVGHVCIGYIDDLRLPRDWFVIKIIKPLAIAQSCWEYDCLKNVFPPGSCEDSFVKNTLRSNGAEMNVANEIANLERSHEMYTTDYQTEFGMDIDAKLTTIENKPGIIKPGVWFSLAMTLAPGVPLSDLIENNLLENDTKLRANLHRCLDLLVVRFFYTLISSGFYHGDLHSGNIFYSYRHKQITLIDFGAMGDIDLFAGDETTLKLLNIIIMSVFYNYDGMLDHLTDILNSKCSDDPDPSFIDKNSEQYLQFKTLLTQHKIKNTMNYEKEAVKAQQYMEDITSQRRLDDEKQKDSGEKQENEFLQKTDDDEDQREPSIYDYFEKVNETKETIVEDKDILPVFTEVTEGTESISFAGVMQLIIKFYATSNVNVAVKFAELNELQKAYALLLGVLTKVSYSSYRMSQAMRSAIITWKHIPKLFNVRTSKSLLSYYSDESTKFDALKELLIEERKKFTENRIKRSFM